VVVVVLAVGGLVTWLIGPGSGAAEPGVAVPLPHFAPAPSTYHITYRVTASGAPAGIEQLWVSRPFDSVDEQLSAPGAVPYLVTVGRVGDQVLRSGSSDGALFHVAATLAPHDIRLDAVIGPALRSDRLRVVGAATVAGRRCRVYRSAAPLGAGPLTPLTPGNTYADTCVDDTGLILSERVVKSGDVADERVAESVEIGPAALSGADFSMTGTPTAPNQGGGSIHALTLDSRPAKTPFWGFTRTPAGFQHTGRYAVVPAQPDAWTTPYSGPANGLGVPGWVVSALDDTYERGPDAVVIDQGATLDGSKFAPPAGGQPVYLGPSLGEGQLVLSAAGSEVVAEPQDGTRFVRIVGTLPPDQLLSLARSLTLQPPGTLVRAPAGSQAP